MAVCGVKSPEVPVMTTVAAPVVAVLLAVRVKMLVVALVEVLVEVNEALTPLGRPKATKLTPLVKPPVAFTVIVIGTLLP
jgi:hypothetical protein